MSETAERRRCFLVGCWWLWQRVCECQAVLKRGYSSGAASVNSSSWHSVASLLWSLSEKPSSVWNVLAPFFSQEITKRLKNRFFSCFLCLILYLHWEQSVVLFCVYVCVFKDHTTIKTIGQMFFKVFQQMYVTCLLLAFVVWAWPLEEAAQVWILGCIITGCSWVRGLTSSALLSTSKGSADSRSCLTIWVFGRLNEMIDAKPFDEGLAGSSDHGATFTIRLIIGSSKNPHHWK